MLYVNYNSTFKINLFANKERNCETLGTPPLTPVKGELQVPTPPHTCDLAVWPSGVLCTLWFLQIIHLFFQISLTVAAEVHFR